MKNLSKLLTSVQQGKAITQGFLAKLLADQSIPALIKKRIVMYSRTDKRLSITKFEQSISKTLANQRGSGNQLVNPDGDNNNTDRQLNNRNITPPGCTDKICSISLVPLNELKKGQLYKLPVSQKDDMYHCFDVVELWKWVKSNRTNPVNRSKIDDIEYKKIESAYLEYKKKEFMPNNERNNSNPNNNNNNSYNSNPNNYNNGMDWSRGYPVPL